MMNFKSGQSYQTLGPFMLAMIAIIAIIDLRGIPMMASYGLSAIFLYGIAAIFFLIPSSLICAELATAFPQAGGLYAWVSKAFGDKVGFFAIWLEWINNVVSFPASISFITVTLTYLYDPKWMHEKYFVLCVSLIILWGTTLFTCLGIRASSWLNVLGALFGTIIPALIITSLGICWLFSGHHPQINLVWKDVLPDMHGSNLAFFSGTLLGYAGIQVIAFHAPNVKDPKKSYPRAIFIAVIVILMVTVLATFATAVVVPHQELTLVSGLMEGFSHFFNTFHLGWATPVLAALIALSVLATLNTWFLGPARGLVVAAQKGYFFKKFAYINRYESPVFILLLQAVVASIFLLLFFYMPDISGGFWILLNLSGQSTLIMYILIFSSAVKLRSQNRSNQAYTIPGGPIGVWLVALLGILTCLFALVVSIIPPAKINVGSVWHYEVILLVSNFIFLSVPFIIMFYARNQKQFPTLLKNNV